MVASRKTINKILDVLQKHLEQEQIKAIMNDLLEVEGNKSFKDTVEGILSLINFN